MDETDSRILARWAEATAGPIPLRLLLAAHPAGSELRRFADAIAREARNVEILEDRSESAGLPGIHVSSGIIYHAAPWGQELPTFLSIAAAAAGVGGRPEPGIRVDGMRELEEYAQIELFIARECPFCPASVREIASWSLAGARTRLRVIECELFPEIAEARNVTAAPTLAMGRFLWTGRLPMREIAEVISRRDAAALGMQSLEDMLARRQVDSLVEMMIERGRIFPALLELLTIDRLEPRLGAMVAIEELAARDRRLAGGAVEALWRKFEEAEDRVKGDILWAIGKTADAGAIPILRKIADESHHPDVREAAQEALEELEKFLEGA